ncbi:hypothetical protein BEI60_31285 [Eisenbergiella tayi]|nr:hypothetical protein BEI60_31285 [Eisenbergiella tayi]
MKSRYRKKQKFIRTRRNAKADERTNEYRQCCRRGKTILPPLLPPVSLCDRIWLTGWEVTAGRAECAVWAFVKQEN